MDHQELSDFFNRAIVNDFETLTPIVNQQWETDTCPLSDMRDNLVTSEKNRLY